MELIAQFPLGVLFSSNIPRLLGTKIQGHFFKNTTAEEERKGGTTQWKITWKKCNFNYIVNLELSPLCWESLWKHPFPIG